MLPPCVSYTPDSLIILLLGPGCKCEIVPQPKTETLPLWQARHNAALATRMLSCAIIWTSNQG